MWLESGRGQWSWLAALVLTLALWGGGPKQEVSAASNGVSSAKSSIRPAYVVWLRSLEDLAGPAFDARAAEICAGLEPAALDALIARAGTSVPPGLPEAVYARREALRSTATEWLRRELQSADPERARAWQERLQMLVRSPQDDALWAAAARCSAALGLVECAPWLAQELAPGRAVWRAEVARAALYQLYRRWYATTADFEAFYALAKDRPRAELFLDDLEREQQEAHELRLRLIDALPQREAVSALGLPDPALRARAARALRRGVGEGRVQPEEAIESLLSHLEHERDPTALRATADALLQLLSSSPPDSPRVQRLRALLLDQADHAPAELEWPLLEALARIAWSKEARAGVAEIAYGQTRVSELLRRLVQDHAWLDSDVLVQAIELWRNLMARSGEFRERSNAALLPGREAIDALLSEGEVSAAVRLAAASSIGLLLPPDPAQATHELVALVERESLAPEVEVELLRAFTAARIVRDPYHSAASELRRVLLARLSHAHASVRGRVLEIVGHVGAANPLDAETIEALLVRLQEEPQAELQASLLTTLTATQRPELLPRILATQGVQSLLTQDLRRAEDSARALRQLVAKDSLRSVQLAEELCSLDAKESRAELLEQALATVFALPLDAARALAPEQHYAILEWALELRERAGLSPIAGESLLFTLTRLVQVHAELALRDYSGDVRALAHPYAVFLGEWTLASQPPGDPAAVLDRFAAALAYATEQAELMGSHSRTNARILRDRARFLDRVGRGPEALADYQLLLEELPLETVELESPAIGLELFDLRRAAHLLAAEAERTAAADAALASRMLARACHIGLALVRQASWQQLPPQTRLEDLRQLTEHTLRCNSSDERARLQILLADLPNLPTNADQDLSQGSATPGSTQPTVWRGLLRERAWHESLLELKLRLQSPPSPPKSAPGPNPASRSH